MQKLALSLKNERFCQIRDLSRWLCWTQDVGEGGAEGRVEHKCSVVQTRCCMLSSDWKHCQSLFRHSYITEVRHSLPVTHIFLGIFTDLGAAGDINISNWYLAYYLITSLRLIWKLPKNSRDEILISPTGCPLTLEYCHKIFGSICAKYE